MVIALLLARLLSYQCDDAPTSWVERTPESYRAVCGDEDGIPQAYVVLVEGTIAYVRYQVTEVCDRECVAELEARGIQLPE